MCRVDYRIFRKEDWKVKREQESASAYSRIGMKFEICLKIITAVKKKIMKQKDRPIKTAVLESICKVLGDTNFGLKGIEIGRILADSKISDIDSTNTKWKRLYNAFVDFQNKKQLSNNILAFIQSAISPARFTGKEDKFEYLRTSVNESLSFIGLKLRKDGRYSKIKASKTISEAEKRAKNLKSKLERRNAHPDIFVYCRAELLTDNYFHAVFEAAKSVADKIRNKTGLTEDGASLVDIAFGIKNPCLRINDLKTETEESEHKGFANLLRGMFGMFRNTTAHAPKITWTIDEKDALDILSLISLIHRRLDSSK